MGPKIAPEITHERVSKARRCAAMPSAERRGRAALGGAQQVEDLLAPSIGHDQPGFGEVGKGAFSLDADAASSSATAMRLSN